MIKAEELATALSSIRGTLTEFKLRNTKFDMEDMTAYDLILLQNYATDIRQLANEYYDALHPKTYHGFRLPRWHRCHDDEENKF